jgi:hypothetical protein
MNAILQSQKRCVDCLQWHPLAEFGFRRERGIPYTTCGTCRRARWIAARQRWRIRQLGEMLEPQPVTYMSPPTDFLDMGEPDRSVALRWGVGVAV